MSKAVEAHWERLSVKAEEAVEAMLSGFSVAVYGCGSKIQVLDGIGGILMANRSPSDAIIRIRGYDQTFPMIRTISSVLTGGADGRRKNNSIRHQSDVLKAIEKRPKNSRVFFLIDSIDAAPMKGNQEFFAKLAEIPSVDICASVDHCRVGLLWSPPQLRRFRWFWVEASTYKAYTAEVRDMVTVWDDLIEGKADAATRSLGIVLASLTGAHREAVELIAKMQVEAMAATAGARKEGKENSEDGVAHSVQIRSTDLVKRCKKQMIADNQVKMRSLLQELIDHRLVLNMKDRDTGNEVFWLPFDQERLQRIAAGEEFN